MKMWRRVGCCLATVAGLAFGAQAVSIGDELLVNGGFESGSNDPGWTGGGVGDKQSAYKPPAAFFSGNYIGIIQMSSYKQQVFTNANAATATLSWRYQHRTDYNQSVPMYYTVLLDGEVIRAEEKIADTTAHSASTENIELGPGEHTLKFQGRTDSNKDSTFFIDDISLTVTKAVGLVVEPIPDQTFTGSGVVPDLQVSYWDENGYVALTKGVGYDVVCSDNVGIGTASITVTGLGEYAAYSVTRPFQIVAPTETEFVLAGDFSRNVIPVGSAAKIANLRVTDGEGRDLDPATYEVSYVNNALTGFATVWATGASGARAGEVLAAANFEVVVLPEGYQPLDAIVGTGTQYIDTGVKPTTTLQTDIVFTPGDSGLSESAIFGADWSTTGYFLMFYQYKFRFQSRGKTADLSAILLNERNTATCSPTGYRANGVSASLAGTSSDKAQNIHIFDANNASKRGAFKLHAFAMRSGATTLLDLVPVLRVADGRPGLLDLAHPDAAMLENAGTGEFGAESARLSVAPIENQIFTGAALEPAPAVTDRGSGAALVAGRDYEVAYSNNTTAGTGYAFVTGKGDYAGYSQTTAFYIARRVFVKTDALDGGTGVSWEDAMTYTNALQFAATSGVPVEVFAAAGTYSYTGHTLATPVTVRGATGDPKDVIINDNTAGQRAFTLKHADAVIRDLTIKGAGTHKHGSGYYGGHINMTAGTVENCIIRDGYSNAGASGGHSYGRGGNVYMTGGRLVRCQILNGNLSASGGNDGEYGGGVFASGAAVIDSCLVKGNNANSVSKGWGGGIYAEGAVTVANCTIVGNKVNGNSSGGGIYVNSSLVRVVNCILFNNGGTAATEFGTVNLGRFLRCASSVTNDSCATWTLMSKGDFTGFEADDFHLSLASPLLDGGSLDAAWYPPGATTLDIDGNPRVSGLAIDLGCYEADQSRVIASGAVLPCGYEGTNMTLTASAKGGTGGPYLYRWDCGNGVTNVTADAVSAYAWPDSGLYVIKVQASDNGGATWGAWSTLPVKLVIAPKTVYVSATSANPTYPYKTPETAAKKVSSLLAAFTNNVSSGRCAVDGLTVRVLPGTVDDYGIVLAAAVEIVGDTGNPADVTIRNNTAGQRAFNIEHAGAVVRDLTVSGSGMKKTAGGSTATYGGHVYMTAGTVENCIITGGNAAAGHSGGWGRGIGGNVYMTGGRLVRSQILNGISVGFKQSKDEDSRRSYGAGVYAAGTALVDSCLIKGNGSNTLTLGMGVYVAGNATVANCTVVNSYPSAGYPGAGVYVGSGTAKVVNTILFNNGGTDVTEFGDKNLGRFFHCASSVTNESCETWTLISQGDFAGFEANDFRLSLSSPLVDGGSMDAEWYPEDATTLDLDGLPRVSGSAIDLGCYEADQSQVNASGAVSTYNGFEGTNYTLTATAKGGTGGPYLYRWDLGNGVTNETDEAVSAYAWPGSGLYVIKVAASDDDGATWGEWATLPVKVVIAPTTVYVSATSANPTYPYKTRETAATKISTVLTAFTNNVSAGLCAVDGLTVRVLPGTVTDTGMQLAAAVEIVGDTGDPEDVIINDNTAGMRAFTLKHADAVIRDLTIKGAGIHKYNGGYGGHVNMTAGTVENCIIRDGYSNAGHSGGHSYGRGGNVYMSGGRLVRCQILNGHLSDSGTSNEQEFGGGVFASGAAVIDSCLVKGNDQGATSRGWGGGIYAEGSVTVANCTIVDNKVNGNSSGGGIYVNSSLVRVVNCILFNNGGTDVTEFGDKNLGRFFHCASTVDNPDCATWMSVSAGDFVSVPTANFRLQPTSALVDAGSTDSEWYPDVAAERDLDGNPRVSISVIDLGCYEIDQSKISVGGGLSNYGGLEGRPIRFTASAKGGTGGAYTYRWDFGNEHEVTTTDAEIEYAYPESGLYTVRVSAMDDGGEWTDWVALAQNVAVMPAVTYVDANSANPTYPYKTRETAATKVSTVLLAMTNNVSADATIVSGATVRVCAGTVGDTGLKIASAVTICGDTGDPNDVIINDNTAGKRGFTLTHAGAVIRDLTIKGQGVHTYQGGSGGHVNMTAGTVENCIIKDGRSNAGQGGGHSYGHGGNVYMTGGRLVRCQILNGQTSNNGSGFEDELGGGVYAGGTAVVDSCLVKDCNLNAGGRVYGGGICADGSARVLNCTVIGCKVNANASGGGVYVRSATAKVVGTVLFDNGGTPSSEFGNANLDCYAYCASSTNNETCATWRVIDETAFRDWAAREEKGLKALVPRAGSPLIDAGGEAAAYAAAGGDLSVDLRGHPRLSGRRLDIGCVEANTSGSLLRLR